MTAGITNGRSDDSRLSRYYALFDRYVSLGVKKDFKKRDAEFKDRRATAQIFGHGPRWIDRMLDEERVAYIKVGGAYRIHIPTTTILLRRRAYWKSGPDDPRQ